jgi:hypothetical protein
MMIVDRATFLSMPEDTVYADYKPCIFGPLSIKGETWGNDFLVQDIVSAVNSHDEGELYGALEDSRISGADVRFDLDCFGRDGMFDDEQLFAVWDAEDVTALIERLKLCVGETGEGGA